LPPSVHHEGQMASHTYSYTYSRSESSSPGSISAAQLDLRR
jgi:hypothetical protein